jgi:uncharacterized protein YndB with AHSA1/START domain
MKINEQPGKFNGPAEVRFVRTLPGPIERVWDYLTDPEKRARWFAGGTMEPRAGGKMRLAFRHQNLAPDETPPEGFQEHHNSGHTMESTVTRWEPPRVLAYTFGSDGESEVTFELTPQGKDVLLVLTHRATRGDVPYMSEFGAGWHTHLTYLIALLEGGPRPPFWPVFVQAKAEYEKLRLAAQPETFN